MTKTKGLDLVEAIERAEKEHADRQVLRIRAREREVRYRKVCYDPLAVYDTMGLPWHGKAPDKVINKATAGQVEFLSKSFKVEGAENLSRAKASTLIDFLKRRRDGGLATIKQVSWLIATGMDPAKARAVTFEEASAHLDQAFRKRA